MTDWLSVVGINRYRVTGTVTRQRRDGLKRGNLIYVDYQITKSGRLFVRASHHHLHVSTFT